MKRSEAYHIAQVAVINSACISPEGKIEVMKVLINDEEVALFSEKRHEEKQAAAE